jgi:hypothetical protein
MSVHSPLAPSNDRASGVPRLHPRESQRLDPARLAAGFANRSDVRESNH